MFYENLMKIMNKKGLTQSELVDKTGIKQTTISSWQYNKKPSIDKVILIINALDISADELLGTNNNHISKELDNVIRDYSKLKEEYQQTIKDMIQMYLNRMTQEEQRSDGNNSKLSRMEKEA